jgi:hypothetical protein
MRFRAGLVAGFAGGFYLGTMAGRERFHQINRLIRRVNRFGAREVGKMVDATADRLGQGPGADPADLSGAGLAPAGPGSIPPADQGAGRRYSSSK